MHTLRGFVHTQISTVFLTQTTKMSVIKTLQLKANEIATTTQGKKKGQENLKTVIQTGPVL